MVKKQNISDPVSFPEMVAALDLETIVYYELGAKLAEGDAVPSGVGLGDEPAINTNWGIRTRHEGKEFGVRIRAEAETALGVLIADVAVEYTSPDQLRIPKNTAYQFVNDVAMMQVFPYIREAFTTLSSRVFGEGVIMPVIKRGDLAFAPSGDAPDVSEG